MITSPRRVSNEVSIIDGPRADYLFGKRHTRYLNRAGNWVFYQKESEEGNVLPSIKSLPPIWPPRLPKS